MFSFSFNCTIFIECFSLSDAICRAISYYISMISVLVIGTVYVLTAPRLSSSPSSAFRLPHYSSANKHLKPFVFGRAVYAYSFC